MSPEYSYRKLVGDVEESSMPSSGETLPVCPSCKKRNNLRTGLRCIACLATLIFLSGLLNILMMYRNESRVMERCWNMHNYYSPVGSALANEPYITTRFNGSLWHDTPFKGPPTPAVEEAWHSIMQYGMIAVSGSDYEKVNHPVRTAVQFPPEAGGGYVATTVGTHQLHCLHYIWQDHHRDYFPDIQRKAREVPELYERHYEHCVDYIRQSIMCQFDTGLVTYDWVLQHQNPTPNSNAMHKCVNWNAVQKWLQQKAVHIPEGFVWKQPEGQQSLSWNP
ncbi:hypothetical protein GQX73_g10816 [Xylaria multiplex]|uniref:Tat pathway signal sequence n=1 Tax=Xylaria multiplex TaxID=323545 RepID=A0A7C8IIZ8_9PEZI|nr:hypothetical protein GQX73_g10816 [Xylaria multiplex]